VVILSRFVESSPRSLRPTFPKDLPMAKASRDLLNSKSEPRYFTFDVEQLTLVTDKAHPLYDPRVELPVDETLVQNILHHGQLDPVKFWRDASDGTLYVVDGRQRYKAIVAANKILKKKGGELLRISAMPKRGTPFELAGVMISQNFIRQAETPIGKAKKIFDYVNKLGRSKEEAATVAGVSITTVENMLRLLDATPELVEAVESKKIAASQAYQLSKLKPEKQKTTVAKLLKEAPRTEGKKRSSNGAKAKAIVEGTTRSRVEVETMGKRLAGLSMTPERSGFLHAIDWMLGDEGGLEGIVEKGDG
jgi:ParB family chromosome partitioning protein